MGKIVAFFKGLFFTVKVISMALVAPVASLVKTTLQAKPVGFGQLAFAFWRLFVWLFFVLCATTSVGVPPLIASLFLIDLVIVGVQIVGCAVIEMKGKPA